MIDNLFSEEILPNIHFKPLLTQLEAISSRSITCYLGEETDPHLSTTSFQVVVESNKVSPQPPFLQTEQPQFPQPLLIRLLLQTLHQLCCPSLDTLQHLNVLLVLRSPKLDSRCGLSSAEYRGTITSLLLDTLFLTQDRMLLAFLATWAHCWLIFSQLSTNTPRSFSARQLLFPKPVALHGIVVTQYLIQTSFKYLQGWRLNHFPGQPVPMLDNPLGEEKFPNIQSKPPLVQLEAISSCPITCYLGEHKTGQCPVRGKKGKNNSAKNYFSTTENSV
ncbi:hypothetical protein QYF61_022244 [Mycteria americana]|uniref:Uncharacterized protein n=1 Tax=Mycteria americana TaxID=33587 RepID=A0AAN7NYE7_MYCAM|nr:hypothetical protein QYF61_022244 [Mycteria americana]